jgi:hypothetical protein
MELACYLFLTFAAGMFFGTKINSVKTNLLMPQKVSIAIKQDSKPALKHANVVHKRNNVFPLNHKKKG